jgi:hypothetical protein
MRIILNSRVAIATLALAAGLAGCDYTYSPMKLAPGSSIDDVRRQMGAATEEKRLEDGSRVLWFVRGPQGFHTYKVLLDKDEKVTSIVQVLTESNFKNIVSDQSKQDDVLELIGRPRERMTFPNLREEVWTWRYQDGTFNKLLHVHFGAVGTDKPGVVTKYVLEQEQVSP